MKLDQAYFDAVIDRAATACEKWDGRQEVFGRGDVIPNFYAAMRAGKTPTTSLLTKEKYIESFEPYLQAGQDILFICFSSELSGTYNNAVLAQQELSAAYPERKLVVVNRITLDGEIEFAEPEQRDPNRGTSYGAGLCSEYQHPEALASANLGEEYPRLGNGYLTKTRPEFNFMVNEPCRPFPTIWDVAKDEIHFTTDIALCQGFAAREERWVRVQGNQVQIRTKLCNLGKRALDKAVDIPRKAEALAAVKAVRSAAKAEVFA